MNGRLTEIQIACLESRAEMPAFASEIDQDLEKGGVLQPFWGPKRVLTNGKLQGIELVRCTRVFDDSGRFNPSFDPSVTTIIGTAKNADEIHRPKIRHRLI
jgi:hypothetical protein